MFSPENLAEKDCVIFAPGTYFNVE